MPQTPETSGSWVEHEVHMIERIILIVIELKLRSKDLGNHTTQLLLELVFSRIETQCRRRIQQTTSRLCNVD